MKFVSPIVSILFVVCTSRAGEVIYVDASGPNAPGTGSYEHPFRRIQDAIDLAGSGDTIIVAEGVYTDDANNRDLNFGGKTITVPATEPNDPSIVANTRIDANGDGRGFYFDSGEDVKGVVAGLIIKMGIPRPALFTERRKQRRAGMRTFQHSLDGKLY